MDTISLLQWEKVAAKLTDEVYPRPTMEQRTNPYGFYVSLYLFLSKIPHSSCFFGKSRLY